MHVLSIANHKGGTGKTATTRALGDVLSSAGVNVLMVDIDPQASLTISSGLGDSVEPNLSDVFGGAQPGALALKNVIHSVSDRLDLAPSNLSMAGVELGLHSRLTGRERVLKKSLDTIDSKYDIVLIDCPPSLSLLTVNALMASDAVLIPTQPLPVDVAGVKLFIQTVEVLKEDNPDLSILGILITFFDSRLNAHKGAINAMESAGWPVLPVQIGRSVRVGESAALGESVVTFEPGNPQTEAYKKLGKLVELWLRKIK